MRLLARCVVNSTVDARLVRAERARSVKEKAREADIARKEIFVSRAFEFEK